MPPPTISAPRDANSQRARCSRSLRDFLSGACTQRYAKKITGSARADSLLDPARTESAPAAAYSGPGLGDSSALRKAQSAAIDRKEASSAERSDLYWTGP